MISRKQFEETLNKLSSFPGVQGVVITNNEGLPIASTMPSDQTETSAALVTALVGKAKGTVRDMSKGQLNWVQMDTSGGEVFLAPEEEYIILVLREKGFGSL